MLETDDKARVREQCAALCAALAKKGYAAQYADNAQEACEAALGLIPAGASVGIPGTVTVRELGLPEKLAERGCAVSHHWKSFANAEERRAALMAELASDWFVTSANAVTQDGIMVNIDGTGNRLGAMAWAPGKILYIIGANKITPDLESAEHRARNIAAPPNARRLGLSTPCAKADRCVDCASPHRMCNVMLVNLHAPSGRECHVIVVGESLGY